MILQTILQMILEVLMHEAAGRLVAHHGAAAVRITNPMPSHATAGTRAGRHDDGAGNDDDRSAAVRAASTGAVAMKAGAAAALYLDHHAVRSWDRCKRHGLCGACR